MVQVAALSTASYLQTEEFFLELPEEYKLLSQSVERSQEIGDLSWERRRPHLLLVILLYQESKACRRGRLRSQDKAATIRFAILPNVL